MYFAYLPEMDTKAATKWFFYVFKIFCNALKNFFYINNTHKIQDFIFLCRIGLFKKSNNNNSLKFGLV